MHSISNPSSKLAHDHFRRLFDDIHRGNQFLDVKTWGLVVLDVLLLALVVAFGGRWPVLVSASAAVAGVLWVLYGARIGARLPGGGTWGEIWNNYIDADDEEALERVMSDLLESIDEGWKNNKRKAWALDGVALALLVQDAAVAWMVIERY